MSQRSPSLISLPEFDIPPFNSAQQQITRAATAATATSAATVGVTAAAVLNAEHHVPRPLVDLTAPFNFGPVDRTSWRGNLSLPQGKMDKRNELVTFGACDSRSTARFPDISDPKAVPYDYNFPLRGELKSMVARHLSTPPQRLTGSEMGARSQTAIVRMDTTFNNERHSSTSFKAPGTLRNRNRLTSLPAESSAYHANIPIKKEQSSAAVALADREYPSSIMRNDNTISRPAIHGAVGPTRNPKYRTGEEDSYSEAVTVDTARWWAQERRRFVSDRFEMPALPPRSPRRLNRRNRYDGERRRYDLEEDYSSIFTDTTDRVSSIYPINKRERYHNGKRRPHTAAAGISNLKLTRREGPLMAAIAAERRREEEIAAAKREMAAARQVLSRGGLNNLSGTVIGHPRSVIPSFSPNMPSQASRLMNGIANFSPLGVPAMPARVMLPPAPISVEQPGAAVNHDSLSPIASRSLLTCSKDFQQQFPNVYAGLCKGLLDVNRLIRHEIVIPIREEISLHRESLRCRRAVTSAISDQVWKPLHGRFPDPSIAPKLVKRLCEYLYAKIEHGIQQAEDERSFLQWLFRLDVENGLPVRVTTTLACGLNSTIANIEGRLHIRRRKGTLMSIVQPDTLTLDIDLIIKALFLNGGQLAEINDDPIFIDRVQAGENRCRRTACNSAFMGETKMAAQSDAEAKSVPKKRRLDDHPASTHALGQHGPSLSAEKNPQSGTDANQQRTQSFLGPISAGFDLPDDPFLIKNLENRAKSNNTQIEYAKGYELPANLMRCIGPPREERALMGGKEHRRHLRELRVDPPGHDGQITSQSVKSTPANVTLRFSNLPSWASEMDIHNLVNSAVLNKQKRAGFAIVQCNAGILAIRVARDPHLGNCVGYAHVTFATAQQALLVYNYSRGGLRLPLNVIGGVNQDFTVVRVDWENSPHAGGPPLRDYQIYVGNLSARLTQSSFASLLRTVLPATESIYLCPLELVGDAPAVYRGEHEVPFSFTNDLKHASLNASKNFYISRLVTNFDLSQNDLDRPKVELATDTAVTATEVAVSPEADVVTENALAAVAATDGKSLDAAMEDATGAKGPKDAFEDAEVVIAVEAEDTQPTNDAQAATGTKTAMEDATAAKGPKDAFEDAEVIIAVEDTQPANNAQAATGKKYGNDAAAAVESVTVEYEAVIENTAIDAKVDTTTPAGKSAASPAITPQADGSDLSENAEADTSLSASTDVNPESGSSVQCEPMPDEQTMGQTTSNNLLTKSNHLTQEIEATSAEDRTNDDGSTKKSLESNESKTQPSDNSENDKETEKSEQNRELSTESKSKLRHSNAEGDKDRMWTYAFIKIDVSQMAVEEAIRRLRIILNAEVSSNFRRLMPHPELSRSRNASAIVVEKLVQTAAERQAYLDKRIVFLRSLAEDVNEVDLRSLFEPFGSILSIRITYNKRVAFVEYEDTRAAMAALAHLRSGTLRGAHLRMDYGRIRSHDIVLDGEKITKSTAKPDSTITIPNMGAPAFRSPNYWSCSQFLKPATRSAASPLGEEHPGTNADVNWKGLLASSLKSLASRPS